MSLNWHCQLRKLSCGLRELHPFLTLRWTSQWVLYLELTFMWKKDVIHRLYQIIFSQHPIPSRSKQRSIFEVFGQFESFSRFWSKRFRSDCFMGSLKLLRIERCNGPEHNSNGVRTVSYLSVTVSLDSTNHQPRFTCRTTPLTLLHNLLLTDYQNIPYHLTVGKRII